jgi:hypothetical protein
MMRPPEHSAPSPRPDAELGALADFESEQDLAPTTAVPLGAEGDWLERPTAPRVEADVDEFRSAPDIPATFHPPRSTVSASRTVAWFLACCVLAGIAGANRGFWRAPENRHPAGERASMVSPTRDVSAATTSVSPDSLLDNAPPSSTAPESASSGVVVRHEPGNTRSARRDGVRPGNRRITSARVRRTSIPTVRSAPLVPSTAAAAVTPELSPPTVAAHSAVTENATIHSTPEAGAAPFTQPRVAVSAVGSDDDGDALTFKWSAPTGSFANAEERRTLFTCPSSPTAVSITVTVSDGHGGIARDTIIVDCVLAAR